MTISQSRPMIELRDLPTEGGRESVPVSRTLLNHPVSYARQNPEFRFLALRLRHSRSRGSCKGSRHRWQLPRGLGLAPRGLPAAMAHFA